MMNEDPSRVFAARRADPVTAKIEQALTGFANERSFNPGIYGYTVRRAKGQVRSGFVASKNPRPACAVPARREDARGPNRPRGRASAWPGLNDGTSIA